MSWNYRVMRKEISNGQFEYGIYEVYYDENGEIKNYTENSLTPVCETKSDLEYEIKMMTKAFEKNTLEYLKKEN